MLDLLEFLVKSLVKNKDAVNIKITEDGKVKIYTVYVDSQDLGQIIGKGGNTAQAIRTIAKSYGSHEKVVVEFDANK